MNDIRELERSADGVVNASRGLGWFSVGLGLGELAAPGHLAKLVGVNDRFATRLLIRALGVVAHSCKLTRWSAVHGTTVPESCAAYARAVARGLAAAAQVIAPSHAMLGALDATYGPRPGPSSVVPNGLPPASPPQVRKRAVILTAGRLGDRAKNVDAVVAAAPVVPWPVWIAGDAGLEGSRASLEASGVRLLGRLSPAAMTVAFETASIYALPAKYEPFGISVLEAAQRECALVLGDIPSLRENWEGAARFVDPDDAEALAVVLRELADDEQERRALGTSAKRRASRFTARATAAATLEIYQGLVARRDATSARAS